MAGVFKIIAYTLRRGKKKRRNYLFRGRSKHNVEKMILKKKGWVRSTCERVCFSEKKKFLFDMGKA